MENDLIERLARSVAAHMPPMIPIDVQPWEGAVYEAAQEYVNKECNK